MSDLKPCPFCGGEAKVIEGFSGVPVFWVECTKCSASFKGYFEIKASAAKAWNTRAERMCKNESEWNEVDGFVCSACGIRLEGWSEVVEVEGQEYDFEYAFKYCPNCGAKVVE